jgi:hypothetical protein
MKVARQFTAWKCEKERFVLWGRVDLRSESNEDGETAYLISIRTDFLRNLEITDKALPPLNAVLMGFASMAGPVFDEHTHTLSLCSLVRIHESIWEWITKFSTTSQAHVRGKDSLPVRFENIFRKLGLSPAPIFETAMPQANATADSMEFANTPRSFREKYGYGRSGDRPLHSYVTDLTRQLMKYVG